ncbi:MAG: potassium transporter [Rhodothermales bacterium]|nr:potassium transporter [Rhodothermales bacterium]MBO6780717.1 potassium transporter [Rhodothermales bacterium]
MVLNLRAVLGTLAALVGFAGVAMLAPVGVAAFYGEEAWWPFLVTALGAMGVGGGVWLRWGRGEGDAIRIREGFAIVALAWIVISLAGAVPLLLGGVTASFTDAFFETVSGFTTTGATILGGGGNPDIESLPNAFLFWRSLTHWLGGMGIIVLTLAILPILGVGSMQLFKAEVPGPTADKLTPRVRETARRLWLIYVGITAVQVAVLAPALGLFEAVNHAFATMATGGFSTRNASVGHFSSAYVDWVITLFMYVAGVNFALHFRLLRGQAITVFRDTEFRVYTLIVLVASVVTALALWDPVRLAMPGGGVSQGYADFTEALRFGAFQSTAIVTTTGFATADYELWPPVAIGVLFVLFFVGGMAGSTGGGVKVVRHVLLFKNSFKEVKQLVHPQAVLNVRLNDRVVPQEVMRNVLSFIVLYFALIGLGTLAMTVVGADILTAFGGALSSVGNVGPAFGTLGPAENYAHIPAAGKWVLSFLMVAGRLEIFTMLIIFAPSFWRR